MVLLVPPSKHINIWSEDSRINVSPKVMIIIYIEIHSPIITTLAILLEDAGNPTVVKSSFMLTAASCLTSGL
jgi:hypothetical protein